MKKIFSLAVSLIFSSLLIMSCTINKPAEKVRTISVSGTGSVSVKPDLVFLKFLVKTTDWNVNKAAEKNATNSTNVINAIKEAGIDVNDISTADYQITQDNSKEYPGMYTVTNTIAVTIRNTEITGNVIDVAVKDKTGANGIIDFEYGISNKETALRQARTQAVQNAQDAASLLAGASGCKVGEVLDIQENINASHSAPMLMNSMKMGAATPILERSIEVSSNVIIKFKLE